MTTLCNAIGPFCSAWLGCTCWSWLQVLVSTLTFIISTADELQKVETTRTTKPRLKAASFQDSEGKVQFPTVVFIIETIDNIIIIFFTFEFVVRLLVCPNKMRSKIERTSKIPKGYYPGLKAHFPLGKSGLWGHFPARGDIFRFLKESMNLIDLVAICPFYISLILEVTDFIFMDMIDHKNTNISKLHCGADTFPHDHTKQHNTQISLL